MKTLVAKAIGTMAVAAVVSMALSAAQATEASQPSCATDRNGAMNCLDRTLQPCEIVMWPEQGECASELPSGFLPDDQLDD